MGLLSGWLRLFAKRRVLSLVRAGPDDVIGDVVLIGLLNIDAGDVLRVNIAEGPVKYSLSYGRLNKLAACVFASTS
jgi:hypothetical protein